MWSIGCILFTLLVGKPPFETNSLKETYSRIKKCDYSIPSHIPRAAENLIVWLLQSDPKKRPTIDQAMAHEWFNGFTPNSLPASVLISAPRFNHVEEKASKISRKPLIEVVNNSGEGGIFYNKGLAGPAPLVYRSEVFKGFNPPKLQVVFS